MADRKRKMSVDHDYISPNLNLHSLTDYQYFYLTLSHQCFLPNDRHRSLELVRIKLYIFISNYNIDKTLLFQIFNYYFRSYAKEV